MQSRIRKAEVGLSPHGGMTLNEAEQIAGSLGLSAQYLELSNPIILLFKMLKAEKNTAFLFVK